MEGKKELDDSSAKAQAPATAPTSSSLPEFDDFGLPIRRFPTPPPEAPKAEAQKNDAVGGDDDTLKTENDDKANEHETLKKADDSAPSKVQDPGTPSSKSDVKETEPPNTLENPSPPKPNNSGPETKPASDGTEPNSKAALADDGKDQNGLHDVADTKPTHPPPNEHSKPGHNRDTSIASLASVTNEGGVSEFSHQKLSTQKEEEKEDDEAGWQEMPSYARYDMYNDDDRLIAREHDFDEDEDKDVYSGLGGAGKGYTRVQLDDDAQSATSMDDNTQYLFKETKKGTALIDDDDAEARDAMSQMQATKDLLTEGQRIAYAGVVRLEIQHLVSEGEALATTKKNKKEITMAAEALKMWGQKMMIRVYAHMDISEAEQIMIEQLAEHGVVPKDLTPALHTNARVHNPMAEGDKTETPARGSVESASSEEEKPAEAPPPYENNTPPPYEMDGNVVPEVKSPSQLPSSDKIDIDLRWTVLCDLFLLLLADSVYDARSRVLLERVGNSLDISWVDICRFEKRVTDALEMQQAAEKENWNEDDHMEVRRKEALKKRYMMMGLATVGGGLVIGLSAGLLAPVIGAGLAAGFTTIGVAGTGSFLGGVGGAAIITSASASAGGIIGVRAANRRTGAVKTFEYRPLHNNKRVNLVVTVSGWLTGKVDDVRLPFSTVDPVMGDIYSVLWEPDMLRSMGDTIRILATEALSSSIQQILGGTILTALMGAIQIPVVLTKLSYLIDNPWAVSLDRATAAGKILADSLIDRNLGTRPITLVGYSLGARVIFSCLLELSKRGAYGLIQNVYLFGSPVVVKNEEYTRARTVVAGRFVNGYNRNDWILGYLFRLTNGGIRHIAGLAPIEDCSWIENMDVTDLVNGHMDYRQRMPKLLMACGWTVESEEFTEIEDPDPDNHDQRQRELINEIEEARRKLEEDGKAEKKGRFSLFSKRKKAERAEWEVYQESAGRDDKRDSTGSSSHGVLFDVDAIKAELAKDLALDGHGEELQIREIQSTLPPMKLDISPAPAGSPSSISSGRNRPGSLRGSYSVDHVPLQSASESRLPSYGGEPTHKNDYEHHSLDYNRGDEIQMTFGDAFDDGRSSPPPPSIPRGGEAQATRPEMKTSQTLPNITLDDPWGNSDDEDFGKEKEISMTFA